MAAIRDSSRLKSFNRATLYSMKNNTSQESTAQQLLYTLGFYPSTQNTFYSIKKNAPRESTAQQILVHLNISSSDSNLLQHNLSVIGKYYYKRLSFKWSQSLKLELPCNSAATEKYGSIVTN